MIGATVVVTNDDTSAIILSTTWQGTNIAVQVDDGVNYTVTVGDVVGYIIRQNAQSYTAISGLVRLIDFKYTSATVFVDLGLPSGTLWRMANIGANSQEQYGYFFTYGNIKSYPAADSSECTSSFYSTTKGGQLTSSYSSGDLEYDAAAAIIGGGARTPTQSEYVELINNCTYSFTTINGVNGYLFTSKIAGYTDKSIFFPQCGRIWEGSYGRDTVDGYYAMSTITASFINDTNGIYYDGRFHSRSVGECVRPVI